MVVYQVVKYLRKTFLICTLNLILTLNLLKNNVKPNIGHHNFKFYVCWRKKKHNVQPLVFRLTLTIVYTEVIITMLVVVK